MAKFNLGEFALSLESAAVSDLDTSPTAAAKAAAISNLATVRPLPSQQLGHKCAVILGGGGAG